MGPDGKVVSGRRITLSRRRCRARGRPGWRAPARDSVLAGPLLRQRIPLKGASVVLDRSVIDLMSSVVTTFVTTGKVTMPPGRREEVIVLLTDLMAARDRFRAYVELLTAELDRQ